MRGFAYAASMDALLDAIARPPAPLRAWMDVLCAVAAARDPVAAGPALRAALGRRLDLCHPSWCGYHDEDEATLARLPGIVAAVGGDAVRGDLESFLARFADAYQVREVLADALARLDGGAPTVPDVQGDATFDLVIPSNRTTQHAFKVKVAGKVVSWKSVTTNAYFEGLAPNQRLDSGAEERLALPTDAQARARLLLKEALLTGYRLVEPKVGKKRR